MLDKYTILIEGNKFPQFHSTSCFIECSVTGSKILFDTGYIYDKRNLLQSLESMKVSPEEIDYIILSHWHLDHCGNITCFPNAKIIISNESIIKMERAVSIVKESMSHNDPIDFIASYLKIENEKEKDLDESDSSPRRLRAFANMVYRNYIDWDEILNRFDKNQVQLVDKSISIGNLEIFKVSAHTKGDLILNIKSLNVLLIGDIIPYWQDRLIYPMLTEDRESLKYFLETLSENDALVIPGHGEAFSSKKIKTIVETLNKETNEVKC